MTKNANSPEHPSITGLKGSILAVALAGLSVGCQTTLPPQPNELASVDRLLTLIDQRLDVAPLVARAKWNSGATIDDPAREKIILDAVAAQAVQAGIDETFARNFFQNQFDAGKLIQQNLQEQWRSANQKPFTDAPDLGRDVRPVLDKLTPEIITALRVIYPALHKSGMIELIDSEGKKLVRSDINGAPRDLALQTLMKQDGIKP